MIWTGLSASDWDEVHSGLAEAMGYAQIPVTVQVVHEAVSTDFDPLYEEAVGGTAVWDSLPVIGCWVRFTPATEVLTALGLKTGADVLLFIPTAEIRRWNKVHGLVFGITDTNQFVLNGVTYNVEKNRNDPLNVGDGRSQDQVGIYVTGSTKPF